MKLIEKFHRRVSERFLRDLLLFCGGILGIWILLEIWLVSETSLNTFRWALVVFVSQLPVFYGVYKLMFTGKIPVSLGIVGLFFWKGLLLFGSTLLLFQLALIRPVFYFISLLAGVFLVTFYSLHLAVRSHSAG